MEAGIQTTFINRVLIRTRLPPSGVGLFATARKRLFDGPFNTVLTILSAAVLAAPRGPAACRCWRRRPRRAPLLPAEAAPLPGHRRAPGPTSPMSRAASRFLGR